LDLASGIAIAPDRSLYLTGLISTPAYFGNDTLITDFYDAFVGKWNGNNGGLQWIKQITGANAQIGLSVAVGKHQDVFASGYYFFKAGFDSITTDLALDQDLFVCRILDPALSISNHSEYWHPVKLYPNPAQDRVFIALESKSNEVDVLVFDITGSQWNAEMNVSVHLITINTAGLPQGLYFVSVRIGGNTFVKKLVIQH